MVPSPGQQYRIMKDDSADRWLNTLQTDESKHNLLYPASWWPTHPDHIWPAETQSISHLSIYVNVTNTAVEQAWLDGVKIGQYGLMEGSEWIISCVLMVPIGQMIVKLSCVCGRSCRGCVMGRLHMMCPVPGDPFYVASLPWASEL